MTKISTFDAYDLNFVLNKPIDYDLYDISPIEI